MAESVTVKLHRDQEELYVLVQSERRVCKERAMRRRTLKKYWKRLVQIRGMKRLSRDQLLMKVGDAKGKAGRLASLIQIHLPKPGEPINADSFRFEIHKDKMGMRRRHEGRYLLRSNLVGGDPAQMWSHYLLLTEIEQAFKELKCDLNLRPIYHSKDERIEAHIFVCFMAYCLNVTLKNLLKTKAKGLTAKEVLARLSEIQMVDVHLPTTDGRSIVLPRYTQPEKEHQLILQQLGMRLPKQPTPYLVEPKPVPAATQTAATTSSAATDPSPKIPDKRYGRNRPYQNWKCSGDLRRRRPGFTGTYPNRPP